MKKDFSLIGKLLGYSAMVTAATLAVSNNAQAQVYGETVNRDIHLGESFSLDFNLDGIIDFDFYNAQTSWTQSYSTYTRVELYCKPSNLVNAGIVDPVSYYDANSYKVIGWGAGNAIKSSSGTWKPSGADYSLQKLEFVDVATPAVFNEGNWKDFAQHYLGFKFEISGAVKYGWVRVQVNADLSHLTILDYAYESNGGQILTGCAFSPVPTPTPPTPTNAEKVQTINEKILIDAFGNILIIN